MFLINIIYQKKAPTLVLIFMMFLSSMSIANIQIRPLDWSKLQPEPSNDKLLTICSKIVSYSQNGIGREFLQSIHKTKRVNELFDFGSIDPKTKKSRQGAMEDCIRPMTSTSRTLALALRTGQYQQISAGAKKDEIEKILPIVIHSLAKDHITNGGIGKDKWGNAWQSAMWAGHLGQAAWFIWDKLSPKQRQLVVNVLVHESDRFLWRDPPVSNKKSKINTRAEENLWDSTCLMVASTMLKDHPHEKLWREQAIVYHLNAVATPQDVNSQKIVDGKPLSKRLHGYCITKDYAVGNHGAYPHPGYTASSFLNHWAVFYSSLAGVKLPESLFYNSEQIYKMFVDHKWASPPYESPGGTIYQENGGIYWPTRKEKERAGRYYKWFSQDILATTIGFDRTCSIKGDVWAKKHGQIIIENLSGKSSQVKLNAYGKGNFFQKSLVSYLIRNLYLNDELATVSFFTSE